MKLSHANFTAIGCRLELVEEAILVVEEAGSQTFGFLYKDGKT